MPARARTRVVPIYYGSGTTIGVSMSLEIDEYGDAWLTPEQLEEVAALHKWYSHTIHVNKPLRALKRLLYTASTGGSVLKVATRESSVKGLSSNVIEFMVA